MLASYFGCSQLSLPVISIHSSLLMSFSRLFAGVSDALDAWADIDHEQLDKELKSAPKPTAKPKKKAPKTPKTEL